MRHFFVKGVLFLLLLMGGGVGVITFFWIVIPIWIGHRDGFPIDFNIPSQRSLFLLAGCLAITYLGFHLLRRENPDSVYSSNRMLLGSVAASISIVAFICIGLGAMGGIGIFVANQEKAGQRYMDSLTQDQVHGWVVRSIALMTKARENAKGGYLLDFEKIPADLRQLHILSVDVHYDSVMYLWAGGMGCSFLKIEHAYGNKYDVTEQFDSERRSAFTVEM